MSAMIKSGPFRIEKLINYLMLSAVYICVFINHDSSRTRFKYLFYYSVSVIQTNLRSKHLSAIDRFMWSFLINAKSRKLNHIYSTKDRTKRTNKVHKNQNTIIINVEKKKTENAELNLS